MAEEVYPSIMNYGHWYGDHWGRGTARAAHQAEAHLASEKANPDALLWYKSIWPAMPPTGCNLDSSHRELEQGFYPITTFSADATRT